MKRVVTAVVVLGLAIGIAITVYPHCHDTLTCEEVQLRIVPFYKWAPGNTRVQYYINSYTDKPDNAPDITNDVNTAASRWSNVEHDGDTSSFYYEFKAHTTTHVPNVQDGKNVVGWT